VVHTLLFAAEAPPLSFEMQLPLSVMAFLEYAVWGAWFVVLGQYLFALNFSGKQIARTYATISLASIITPFLFGAAADRFIASESLMAILHLTGAVLLGSLAFVRSPRPFYWVMLAYALVYAPTISLSNGIIFANVPDGGRDFPNIRVWGTIGWIVANLFLKVLLKPGAPVNNRPLLLAAVLSAALGVYSIFLPHTPPSPGAYPLDAVQLLQNTSFAVFMGAALLMTLALASYFSFAAIYLEQRVRVRPDLVGPLMTIGQWMEIGFLLLLPFFLKELGMKWVLALGMAAWGIRYALFATGRPFALVLLGLALHGICFDFFFAAGFIYVNDAAEPVIRQSAQALFLVWTYGVGMYLGTEASGWLNHWFTQEVVDPATQQKIRVTDWTKFWLVPCVGAIIALLPFLLLFR
jgi:nucleoside transporter